MFSFIFVRISGKSQRKICGTSYYRMRMRMRNTNSFEVNSFQTSFTSTKLFSHIQRLRAKYVVPWKNVPIQERPKWVVHILLALNVGRRAKPWEELKLCLKFVSGIPIIRFIISTLICHPTIYDVAVTSDCITRSHCRRCWLGECIFSRDSITVFVGIVSW